MDLSPKQVAEHEEKLKKELEVVRKVKECGFMIYQVRKYFQRGPTKKKAQQNTSLYNLVWHGIRSAPGYRIFLQVKAGKYELSLVKDEGNEIVYKEYHQDINKILDLSNYLHEEILRKGENQS